MPIRTLREELFTLYERVYTHTWNAAHSNYMYQEGTPKIVGTFSGTVSNSQTYSSSWQVSNSTLNSSIADNNTNIFFFNIGNYNSSDFNVTNKTSARKNQISCFDTDGGKNYTVAGNVTSGGYTYSDYCFNYSSYGSATSTGNFVMEYFCDNNTNKQNSIGYNCSAAGGMCSNNACTVTATKTI